MMKENKLKRPKTTSKYLELYGLRLREMEPLLGLSAVRISAMLRDPEKRHIIEKRLQAVRERIMVTK